MSAPVDINPTLNVGRVTELFDASGYCLRTTEVTSRNTSVLLKRGYSANISWRLPNTSTNVAGAMAPRRFTRRSWSTVRNWSSAT